MSFSVKNILAAPVKSDAESFAEHLDKLKELSESGAPPEQIASVVVKLLAARKRNHDEENDIPAKIHRTAGNDDSDEGGDNDINGTDNSNDDDNNDGTGHNENDSDGNDDGKDGYVVISAHESRLAKFRTTQFVSEFIIQGADKASDPEEHLKRVFSSLIANAYNAASAAGQHPDIFSMLLFSDTLKDPISIPLRSRAHNTAEAILNSVLKVSQSAVHANLLNAKLTSVVTTVSLPTGSGGRPFPKQLYGINRSKMIEFDNNDSYCLFYALDIARMFHDEAEIKRRKQVNGPTDDLINRKVFARMVGRKDEMAGRIATIMKDARIQTGKTSYGLPEMEKMQAYYDVKYPGMYRIVAFSDESDMTPIYNGPSHQRRYEVTIYLADGHYTAVKSTTGFFNGSKHFCVDCCTTYERIEKHGLGCVARCKKCTSMGYGYPCPPERGISMRCNNCHRVFYSRQCFELHQQNQTCKSYSLCQLCDSEYCTTGKLKHVCGESFCKKCNVHHDKERGCFIRPIEPLDKPSVYRIISYDFEASQDLEVYAGVYEHTVNYCSARITCTRCIDGEADCGLCGDQREFAWSAADGVDPLECFVDWILQLDNKCNTYAYAHFAGRYDGHFVLQRLYQRNVIPELIVNGCKIYQATVSRPGKKDEKKARLVFRDSFLVMPVKLAGLKKALNLSTENKLHFPHLYNKNANFGKQLDHLPPASDYCPDSMSVADREAFLKWYDDNKNTPFCLEEQLAIYCQNDTSILLEALIKMRQILLNITKSEDRPHGYDVFGEASTIAGICMKLYRAMFLKADHLAIVPEHGYERCDRQSVIAIKYLEWREKQDGVRILHAGNGGEKVVDTGSRRYKLDGYIEAENKAVEVLGCRYHGCPTHNKPDDLGANKKTAAQNLSDTNQRTADIRKLGIDVEERWECEILEEKKRNKEMREFFDDQPCKGPIDPRDAYSGGRTGPVSLMATADDTNQISMADIVSLYPFINYSTEYPVGVPRIIIPDNGVVDWRKPEDMVYNGESCEGLLKVRVIPPDNLRLPVLPLKVDERLLFGLCRKCAVLHRKASTRSEYVCKHTDAQRAFTTTVTSIELAEALRNGYVIDRVYRIWQYDNWDSDVFKPYVRLFLKLKVEASGWPSDVITDVQKTAFVAEYRDRLGVEIEMSNVSKNAGLRYIAKLCLNSLWGRFSMRNTLSKTVVIKNAGVFFEHVRDHRIEISAVIPVSDDAVRIIYHQNKEFVEENPSSNIVISLWTTSAARLALYRYMREVDDAPGCRLLYTDTDSVIYSHPRGSNPLTAGEFLGQMTLEYDDSEIVEFICGGAKQYALKLRKKTADGTLGDTWNVMKVRGITLDAANRDKLPYDTMKQMVQEFGNCDPVVFEYPHKFGPTRDSKIIAKGMLKKYSPVCQKGMIRPDFSVVPFGYREKL